MVIIVGAGLAGLACATRLEAEGRDWLLLEAEAKPGGRVATETTSEGYRLDAGFQVLLDSYPTARRLLDFGTLEPRYFESGALLADTELGWERLINPLSDFQRNFSWALPALASKAFSWREKITLSIYAVAQILTSDKALLSKEAGISTLEELQRLGLDGAILDRFLRPFFSGVFLDAELGTDASVFRYDLKKFALGRALLPAGGMGKIPEQLASRLPSHRQRYGATVTRLSREADRLTAVELLGGERVGFDTLVLATAEVTTRQRLGLPQALDSGDDWLEVTTLYFTGEEPLYAGALLVLPRFRSDRNHLVAHFADLTNIAPEYAPPGKRLLSATVLNESSCEISDLAHTVQAEISTLLPSFSRWEFLKEVRIRRALPSRKPGFSKRLLPLRLSDNLFLAGDQISPVGIESALASGLRTAEELLIRA